MRTYGIIGKFIQAGGAALALLLPLDAAHANSFSVLHTFHGGSDGEYPSGGLVEDGASNLYGMTGHGGGGCNNGCGTVFKLAPEGAETVLYVFAGGNDGYIPSGGLIQDKAGNLYGTTIYGGNGTGCSGGYGCGTVFKLASDGTETLLYAFAGGSDGAFPYAGLTEDSAGNLYGTTSAGGGIGCSNGDGCGTVFKVNPDGTEKVLYAFTGGSDGASPVAGLLIDGQGYLYGTTRAGGDSRCESYGCGTVFKLAPDDTETVLYAFAGGNDGAFPYAGLIKDKVHNFYGITSGGGRHNKGTLFRLAADGSETVLHAFAGGSDGAVPVGGLIKDKTGNFYGTTSGGGVNRRGTVFKLAPDGTETVLHSFGEGTAGGGPDYGVIKDKDGYLSGATANGRGNNDGAVFRLRE